MNKLWDYIGTLFIVLAVIALVIGFFCTSLDKQNLAEAFAVSSVLMGIAGGLFFIVPRSAKDNELDAKPT